MDSSESPADQTQTISILVLCLDRNYFKAIPEYFHTADFHFLLIRLLEKSKMATPLYLKNLGVTEEQYDFIDEIFRFILAILHGIPDLIKEMIVYLKLKYLD